MVPQTTAFLFDFVLLATDDYLAAEGLLSQAYAATQNMANCQREANLAIRRACEASIALDGLTDRAHIETKQQMNAIRATVDSLCVVNGYHRQGAYVRVGATANAYKHSSLSNPRHPITSFGNIVAVGPGYGIDGYGIGKFSGVEGILTQTNGPQRKLLGDIPYSVRGWLLYLQANGAVLPTTPIAVCNLRVWP